MSSKIRNFALLFAVFASLAGRGLAQTSIGSITITGAEQSSGSTWDTGTVTATINGVSASFTYGQFTTPASIASALGALISNNCSMPVYAQANGATLTFYQKGSNTISSASITSASSNPSMFPTDSFLVSGGGSWSPPQISSLSMTEGPTQMGVIIYGANFGSTQGTVLIGNVAATILSWSSDGTQIIVQVPSGLSPSIYNIVVETATWSGFNVGTSAFQVVDPFGCS